MIHDHRYEVGSITIHISVKHYFLFPFNGPTHFTALHVRPFYPIVSSALFGLFSSLIDYSFLFFPFEINDLFRTLKSSCSDSYYVNLRGILQEPVEFH